MCCPDLFSTLQARGRQDAFPSTEHGNLLTVSPPLPESCAIVMCQQKFGVRKGEGGLCINPPCASSTPKPHPPTPAPTVPPPPPLLHPTPVPRGPHHQWSVCNPSCDVCATRHDRLKPIRFYKGITRPHRSVSRRKVIVVAGV